MEAEGADCRKQIGPFWHYQESLRQAPVSAQNGGYFVRERLADSRCARPDCTATGRSACIFIHHAVRVHAA
jgi:hypothetical protein